MKPITLLLLILPLSLISQNKSTKPQWKYDKYGDEMEGTTTYIASIKSNEILKFSFPYQNQRATMHLRSDGAVLISVNAQFLAPDYDYPTVNVKFNEETPFSIKYNTPSDHSGGTIFLDDLFDRIVKSKQFMVKALFYQDGYQTFTFDMTGLLKSKIGVKEVEEIKPIITDNFIEPIITDTVKFRVKLVKDSPIYKDSLRTKIAFTSSLGDIYSCYGITGNSYKINANGLRYVYIIDAYELPKD